MAEARRSATETRAHRPPMHSAAGRTCGIATETLERSMWTLHLAPSRRGRAAGNSKWDRRAIDSSRRFWAESAWIRGDARHSRPCVWPLSNRLRAGTAFSQDWSRAPLPELRNRNDSSRWGDKVSFSDRVRPDARPMRVKEELSGNSHGDQKTYRRSVVSRHTQSN